jgi:hypothetical protein
MTQKKMYVVEGEEGSEDVIIIVDDDPNLGGTIVAPSKTSISESSPSSFIITIPSLLFADDDNKYEF